MTLRPDRRYGLMSNVASEGWAAPAAPMSVTLPVDPTSLEFTNNSAKLSTATYAVPATGCPCRPIVLANTNAARSAGVVGAMPGAQIQAAPGIADRSAGHPQHVTPGA